MTKKTHDVLAVELADEDDEEDFCRDYYVVGPTAGRTLSGRLVVDEKEAAILADPRVNSYTPLRWDDDGEVTVTCDDGDRRASILKTNSKRRRARRVSGGAAEGGNEATDILPRYTAQEREAASVLSTGLARRFNVDRRLRGDYMADYLDRAKICDVQGAPMSDQSWMRVCGLATFLVEDALEPPRGR